MKKKKTTRILCAVLCAIFVITAVAADIICFQPSIYQMIDSYLGGLKVSDIDAKNASYEAGAQTGRAISTEGMVLLKNENNTLPLTGVTQVNLFGYASAHFYTTGHGSGANSNGNTIALKESFENVGISINTELYDKYTSYGTGDASTDFITQDPPISDTNFYSDELWASYEAFSDVAIMVIGRTGGEAMDDPHGYLCITENESALLKQLEQRFGTVIVLINIGNAMELGFLDDAGVDAAVLTNYTGDQGAYAVGELLTGASNFSGKTVDTYAYDHSTSPSYYSCGLEATRKYTGMPDDEMDIGYYYVDYTEGIYVGYRYYETRFVDNETGEIDEAAYKETVQYPFGYGLSYTTFQQEIVSHSGELSSNGSAEITVTVKVTNTGSVAGKEVVQLYDTAPYYAGGIEKSHVDLVAFAKTEELAPGASTEVMLSFIVQNLASYDYDDRNQNGHIGYELDAGEYILSIRSDAHTVLDSFTLELANTVNFDTDSKTGNPVSNLFDDVAGQDETEPVKYLSRADWEGTWKGSDGKPDSALTGTHRFGYDGTYTEGRAASEAVKSGTTAEIEAHYADNDDLSVEMPVTGKKNGLTLADMVGLAYDDPKWDDLLDQMTVADMQKLVSNGGYVIGGVDSVGVANCTAVDGPSSVNSPFSMNGGESVACYGYPNETMVACTWNTDLAYQEGVCMATEAGTVSVVELYAPAVNIHRSPYSGRNYEYYSEDAVISGKMAAAMIQGCSDNDLMTTIKHFGVNDQETSRNMNGLFTWCNEQALREIYLRAFEIGIKDSDCYGVMSSFNRIGAIWTGASKALLVDLLRNEWGFVGMVETDAFFPSFGDDTFYMSPNAGIRAGNDLWLQSGSAYSPDTDVNEAYSVACMRNACHNILYALAKTNAAHTDLSSGLSTWAIALIVVSAVIYVGAAAAIYMVFIRKPKNKVDIVK